MNTESFGRNLPGRSQWPDRTSARAQQSNVTCLTRASLPCSAWYKTSTLKRNENATSKIWNLRFHNILMTLIYIYKAKYITWLPFVFPFISVSLTSALWRHMLRHLYNEVMAISSQFQSKRSYENKCAGWFTFQMTRHFWPSLHNGLIKHFLRLSLPLFCWFIKMITENSYFAEKLSIWRTRDVTRRTADICVRSKRKLKSILTFRNAGNVKSNWR